MMRKTKAIGVTILRHYFFRPCVPALALGCLLTAAQWFGAPGTSWAIPPVSSLINGTEKNETPKDQTSLSRFASWKFDRKHKKLTWFEKNCPFKSSDLFSPAEKCRVQQFGRMGQIKKMTLYYALYEFAYTELDGDVLFPGAALYIFQETQPG